MRKTNIGRYGVVPLWITKAARAEPLRLFCLLSVYANNEHKAWPSVKRMAEELGCAPSAVKKWMRELIELGAVVVEHRLSESGDPATNMYTLELSEPQEGGSHPCPTSVTSVAGGWVTDVPEGWGTSVDPKKTNGKIPILKKTPPYPPRGEYSVEFEQFWEARPRRGGDSKQKAWKAWRASLKRGNKPADLTSGQEREKVFYTREGRTGSFIPMRATWLNEDRHLDDYEVDDGMAEVRKRVAARQRCKEAEGNDDNWRNYVETAG